MKSLFLLLMFFMFVFLITPLAMFSSDISNVDNLVFYFQVVKKVENGYLVNATLCYNAPHNVTLNSFIVTTGNVTIDYGNVTAGCHSKLIVVNEEQVPIILQEKKIQFSFVVAGLYRINGTLEVGT